MQSFIIVSKDREEGEVYALTMCDKEKIDPFDRVFVREENDKAIGIGTIRNLQKTAFLRPRKDKKAIILPNFQTATIEAQNALLKILEEPPPHAMIIIVAKSAELLLPTIRSRCTVIQLKNRMQHATKKETEQIKLLLSIPKTSVSQKLKLAQDLSKTKEETIVWLEKTILALREGLITHELMGDTYFVDVVKNLQQTHTILSTTNANPRLMLENLFLSLGKT